MNFRTVTVAFAVSFATFVTGCGGGTTAPDTSNLPTSMILTGAWSGSLARPSGGKLQPIDVSWVTKPSDSFSKTNLTFSGPVTLSHVAATSSSVPNKLSGLLSATLSGTAALPLISLTLNVEPGAATSTLKNCTVQASGTKATVVTATSIVLTVTISFGTCPELLNGQSNAVETDELTLAKLYVQ